MSALALVAAEDQTSDTTSYVIAYLDQIVPSGACALSGATSTATSARQFEARPHFTRLGTRSREGCSRQLFGDAWTAPALTDQEKWNVYLARLTQSPVNLPSDLANAVRSAWWRLCWRVGRPLRLPAAGPGGDLGFQLSWNADDYYLDIDIAPDSTFEWFFKDRRDGTFAGSDDDRHTTPPEELVRLLVRFCLDG